jgi:hypothetical protein
MNIVGVVLIQDNDGGVAQCRWLTESYGGVGIDLSCELLTINVYVMVLLCWWVQY